MILKELTEREKLIVLECLKCVASGEVIYHDWEFSIIMNVTPEEIKQMVKEWPEVNLSNDKVYYAINDSMNNLLGYPHSKQTIWDEYFAFPREEVKRVFRKWKDNNTV